MVTGASRIAPLALGLLLASCAQGSSDEPGTGRADGGTGRTDGSTGRADGGRSDGGTRRDGSTSTCTDEGHGAACETATDLGSLMPGDEVTPMVGYLPSPAAEDWFQIAFPPLGMPSGMAGGGAPSIEFAMNEGDVYRFEVRTSCSATFSCGDGTGARDITGWSFTDDQSPLEAEESGEMDFSTRDMPWPETIYVRVYRGSGSADCTPYQLRVTR